MKKRLLAILTVAIATVMIATNMSQSSLNGVTAGYCGAPADAGRNCTSCHTATIARKTGWITSNIPASGYVPGQTYTITAKCIDAGRVRFGFQISPQSSSGTKLGTLIVTNATTTKLVGTSKYIDQTQAGSAVPTGTSDSLKWSFNWTAPAAGSGRVVFYGAFNGANNDGSESGDHIFLDSSYAVTEGCSVVANIAQSGSLSCPQDSATLTASGGTSYSWSTGATTAAIVVKTGGTYTCTVSNGTCSASKSVTLAGTTCGAPDSIYMTNVFGKSAILNWPAVPCATGYVVKYKKLSATTWSTSTFTTPVLKKTFTTLTPLTTYQVYVQSKCGSVLSAPTATLTFTTLCSCDMPAAIVASTPTSTSATFSWTGNTCAVKYKVVYRQLGAATWKTVTVLPPLTTKTITGLLPSTSYEWHLRTDCNTTGTFNSGFTVTDTLITPAVRLSEEMRDIEIFPNPSNGLFNISEPAEVTVFDVTGQVVFRNMVQAQFDLSNFPGGIYMVEVKANDTVLRKKIELVK